ncbi:unnamed protein product [Toxocara canis]|uniref:Tetraspanin-31 n=1 Tax=Toxocara canis TaxID=6265 RepID=A0A183TXR2_TOXCA|nr:unnamed protein product [Toxocara canis]
MLAVAVFLILVGAYVKGASIVTSHSVIGGIIAVGVFLLLVSLLGLYGTSKHHQVALFFHSLLELCILLLFQYMVILGFVFLIQLSVTIACLAAVNRDGISELVRTGWKSSSNETIWDAENNFQCCGLEGPHDAAYRCHELACASTFCEPCLGIIVNKMRSNLRRLGGIGLFFSFSELLGIWLAIRYRNLKDPKLDPVLYFQQQSS